MENLFNKIFPLKCIFCEQIGEIICENCLYDCDILDLQYCIVCDKPSFYGFTHDKCLINNPNAPKQCISVYKYKEKIRDIIKISKFGSKRFFVLKKLCYESCYLIKEWGFLFKNFT